MADQVATEFVTTRLPEDMRGKLEEMAERERRSISFMARLLLEEAIEARIRKAKKQ